MDIFDEDHRWISFVTPFFLLSGLSGFGLCINLAASFGIYCAFGGWKFIRVLILTVPRDMHGLNALLRVQYMVWRMKRNRYTIPDLFEETVKRKPNSYAFLYENEKWSFNAVDKYSNKVANYLLSIGVKPGDTVALFMESRPAFVAIWVGISKIGAVPALINFNLRNESLIHCISDSKMRGLICGAELVGAIEEIYDKIRDCCQFKIILQASADVSNINGVTDSSGFYDGYILSKPDTPPPAQIRHSTRKVTDALIYIYTSGTTGLPKAAKVSHARYLMMSYGVNRMLSMNEHDIIYNPLPLYHTAGGMIGVGQVLIVGATMAIRRKFSASNFWSDCVKFNATVIQYIGEVCRYLLAQPIRPEETQHRVRLAFGNGVRPQIWVDFQSRFKVPQIGEFYGATESNANIVNSVNKIGSVGFGTKILPILYPISLVKVDLNTGEPLRDKNGLCIKCKSNEVGELVGKIRDADPLRQFDGYVNTTATGKKIIRDVFSRGDKCFLTGDLLMQDELGFFYFKDRLGDTFRWKGENVSTTEVEAIISNCLGLNDCAVYGVEVPNTEGRAGMAAIVDNGSHVIDFRRLSEKFQGSLPSYARPIFLRICKNLDMTGTFKMKKMDLIKEGFDPCCVDDQLFFFNSKQGEYVTLDSVAYQQIKNGKIVF